jgi:hypothetical protein
MHVHRAMVVCLWDVQHIDLDDHQQVVEGDHDREDFTDFIERLGKEGKAEKVEGKEEKATSTSGAAVAGRKRKAKAEAISPMPDDDNDDNDDNDDDDDDDDGNSGDVELSEEDVGSTSDSTKSRKKRQKGEVVGKEKRGQTRSKSSPPSSRSNANRQATLTIIERRQHTEELRSGRRLKRLKKEPKRIVAQSKSQTAFNLVALALCEVSLFVVLGDYAHVFHGLTTPYWYQISSLCFALKNASLVQFSLLLCRFYRLW